MIRSDSEIIGFEIESNSKLIKVSRNECLVPPLKSFAFSLEKQNKGGESGVLVWDGFAMVYLTNKQGKGQCCCGLFKAIRLLPRTPTAGPISFFRTDCVII